MDTTRILQSTVAYIRREFAADSSGHDWWHIYRVWKTAQTLCQREGGNRFIVELAALLHDLDDWKFNEGEDETPRKAAAWMESCGVDSAANAQVCEIIARVSYKGAGVKDKMEALEGKIVQDADRLDAIGAIGIGRAFAYGGYKNRPLYDPNSPPTAHASFAEYKNSRSATINHFYEKLLLLKDRMNTDSGRQMAQERHEVMLAFLAQFMKEWEGGE